MRISGNEPLQWSLAKEISQSILKSKVLDASIYQYVHKRFITLLIDKSLAMMPSMFFLLNLTILPKTN